MPQSKWERGFWAAVRGGGTGGFSPYPPEHWRPKKRLVNSKIKNRVHKKKIVKIPDISKQLTFFD